MFPENHAAVTCSDTVNFSVPSVIFVTTAGTYKITDSQGAAVTWTLAAGACAPVMALRVWSTGSSVTTGIIRVF
jgi:hypothetical protein